MNVLWIVVDCLRSDACSANGYDRPTTTVIDDRLREEFITFTDACTQSGFTLNVAASMITGTYPSTHGVMNWSDEFQDDIPTYGDISEEMKIAPAEVIPGMNFFTKEWGLDQAFNKVHNLDDKKSRRDCNQATATEIRNKCEKLIANRKLFNNLLWFFDPHTPWLSGREFEGPNKKRDQYDTEIQYVAEELEILFETLERQDQYDETMIIMTGDHGDVFEEYPRLPWSTAGSAARQIPGVKRLFWGDGHLGHLGRPLVEEIVHVPLFMKLPDSNLGGQIEPGQVELIDILPTIIDVVGGDIPPTVEGRSLLPLIRGEIKAKNTVRAEMEPSPISGLNRMIRGERYKYLTWQQPELSDLDDLFSDLPTYIARQFFTPQEIALDRTGESENRVGEDIHATKKLKDEMSEWKERRQKANRQISETKKEELKDLGYL